MEIVSRAQWGARYDNGDGPAPLPASEIWLHHSVTPAPSINASFATDASAVQHIEQIGEDRFGSGISYTFVVTPSGRVFEGHSVDRQGTHTSGRNSIGRAIVLVGNYETDIPTAAQKRAVAALLRHGYQAGWWRQQRITGGHRQAPGNADTACPGRNALAAIPEINQRAQEGNDMSWNYPIPVVSDDGNYYTDKKIQAWENASYTEWHSRTVHEILKEVLVAVRELHDKVSSPAVTDEQLDTVAEKAADILVQRMSKKD
ncbi:hypothetical protein GCM10012275_28140 [Longimycelium tulufanense]|uniref:N-acetylmuramoyl-L-alanine amidase n=1 Tax=Longimycelium tulufanense TaxID=907463 RepID=A0A8J3CG26_9PSEU|nr:hypothetical protein GCM10012275_28140 [Longimycelium tulufanense]